MLEQHFRSLYLTMPKTLQGELHNPWFFDI